jgi:predicted MFS family arabinose efflux permease
MAAATGIRLSRFFYLGPFCTMMDRYCIAPMLIPIAVSLGVSLRAAAGVATWYYLAYGLMPPAYGLLSDRWGRVRIIRGALAGVAVSDTLAALAPSLGTLMIARALTGAIACGVLPLSLVYLGDRVPFRHRQQSIADLLVWVALGTTAGTVGAGLITHVATWRLVFLVPAFLGAALALLLRDLPESLPGAATADPLAQVRDVFAHPWALLLFTLALFEGAVMFGFVTYLAPALEASGQSAAVAGLVVGAYGLAVLAGTRSFRRVARLLPPPLILAFGACLMIAGMLLAAVVQVAATILVASLFAGGAYAFMHSTMQTWATDVVPEARGTAAALFVMFVFIGASIATSGMAGLAGAHRFTAVFTLGAAATTPILVLGSIARWRYPVSREPAPAVSA